MTIAEKIGKYLVRTNLKIEKHLREDLIEINSNDLPELRFFQFGSHNARIITSLAGKDDVKLTDTPHYKLAMHLLGGQEKPRQSSIDIYRKFMDKDEQERK